MMSRPFHDVLPSAPPPASDRRLALVIGNGRYAADRDALTNPANDAAGVAVALTRLGFYGVRPTTGDGYDVDFSRPGVTPLVDLDGKHMRAALSAMSRVAGSGVRQVVVYYAGHGIEVAGKNYLIPTDARLGHHTDANWEAILLDSILDPLQSGGGLRIVILDACRNNPFRARLFGVRGAPVGLRSIELVSNDTLVFYAAKHGTFASDGKASGKNSPFAEALLKRIETPGLEIMQLIREVKDDVMKATHGEQEPYVYGSLSARAEYLAPPLQPAASPSQEAVSADASKGPAAGAVPDQAASAADAAAGEKKQAPDPKPDPKPKPGTLGVIAAGVAAAVVLGAGGSMVYWLARPAQDTSSFPARPIRPLQAAEIAAVRRVLAANGAKPSDAFKECQHCPSMRAIPAGRFLLGSNRWKGEYGSANGQPLPVTIARPFAIGAYEVTVDEFSVFVGQTGYQVKGDCSDYDGSAWNYRKDATFRKHYFEQKGDEPVVCVSWNDANAYIAWLNAQIRETGQSGGYRLPSEAEWEYAARGGPAAAEGGRLEYWWGREATHDFANYGNNGPFKGGKDVWNFTGPVSTEAFPPHPFGLAHMLGNVSEWVADCRVNNDHQGNPADGSARNAADCGRRIVRGGSWRDPAPKLTSSFRTDESIYRKNEANDLVEFRADYIGFRVARDF